MKAHPSHVSLQLLQERLPVTDIYSITTVDALVNLLFQSQELTILRRRESVCVCEHMFTGLTVFPLNTEATSLATAVLIPPLLSASPLPVSPQPHSNDHTHTHTRTRTHTHTRSLVLTRIHLLQKLQLVQFLLTHNGHILKKRSQTQEGQAYRQTDKPSNSQNEYPSQAQGRHECPQVDPLDQ